MPSLSMSRVLLLALSCSSCVQLSLQQSCPTGFTAALGRCVLFNTTATVNWCDANRECAKLGAELLTNFAILIALSVKQFIPTKSVWVGVSDIADERASSKVGWQFVNGRGLMPVNESLWTPSDPNNNGGTQDCGMKSFDSGTDRDGLMDRSCTDSVGFACELHSDSATPSCSGGGGGTGRTRWQPVASGTSPPFSNTPDKYCYWETGGVRSARDCAVQAGMRLTSRSFLFNGVSQRCRVMEFTDSQTELELLPTNWTKFIRM